MSAEPKLTALVLREVAAHLECGHVMNVAGEWISGDAAVDLAVPLGRRVRRIHLAARRRTELDIAHALRWIADRNDPPSSVRDGGEQR